MKARQASSSSSSWSGLDCLSAASHVSHTHCPQTSVRQAGVASNSSWADFNYFNSFISRVQIDSRVTCCTHKPSYSANTCSLGRRTLKSPGPLVHIVKGHTGLRHGCGGQLHKRVRSPLGKKSSDEASCMLDLLDTAGDTRTSNQALCQQAASEMKK